MSSEGNLLSSDAGRDLLVKLCMVMTVKLDAALQPPRLTKLSVDEEGLETRVLEPNPEYVSMGAAEMAAIIKLLNDNSITLVSIRRGDFGGTSQRAAEEVPFPGDAPQTGALQ